MKIEILNIDITKIGSRADAIVNAANESLLGGGGVDGAIHEAAGPQLLEECRTLGGCLPGQAKVTKAYNLDNKYIIHTVGPRYYTDSHPERTLRNCYLTCLKLADELGLESIAFPCISIGAFAYPVKEASEIAVSTLCEYEPKTLKNVYICIYYNDRITKIYKDLLKKYLSN